MLHRFSIRTEFMLVCLLLFCGERAIAQGSLKRGSGTVEIDFVEKATQAPLICRVKILDSQGRALRARGARLQSGWNLVESPLVFKGRPGDYTYEVFHGPQFAPGSGGFTLDQNSTGYDLLDLPRHADLEKEGWIGGDLFSRAPPPVTLQWLPAEDLRMAVAVSDSPRKAATANQAGEPLEPERVTSNDENWVHHQSYHDERPGSGLILHHWLPPAQVPAELPSSRLIVMAKDAQIEGQPAPHVEIQQLWARDVPVWLASKRIDSIQLLSDHLTYDGTGARKFKAILDPDPGRFRGPRGPGRFVEYLYWQVLEAGLRIPPSAGSGFGRSSSPLGYNRVYAAVGSVTGNSWWHALRGGQTFVTNGPLLRATINGERPGAVFQSEGAAPVALNVALTLTVSDPVEYLDVIFNGRKLYQARLDEYAKQGGRIPPLEVKESGWIVIRVITERSHTYRFATTAPYYVEFDEQPRISRTAVEFFQQWLETSAALIEESSQAAASGPYLNAARKFWKDQAARANAD